MTAPIDVLLPLLEQPKSAGPNQWTALCPAHEDTTPSLSVSVGRQDQVLLNCHADCTLDDIVDALHIGRADLWPKTNGKHAKTEAVYDYVDETSTLLYQVVRQRDPDGRKKFLQRVPDGHGSWTWKIGSTRRVLYRLPQLLTAIGADETIWIVEGEKDVHALEHEGETATTNPQGAGKWRPDYTEALRDAHVRIVADRDRPGRAHAHHIATELDGVAATVEVLECPVHKDIAEHLGAGGTLDQLIPSNEPTDDHQDDDTPPPPGDDELPLDDREPLPTVIINGRPPADVTTDLLHELEAANKPPVVFIRAGRPTRIRFDENGKPIIEPLGIAELRHRIARITRTKRVNANGATTHVFTPLDACNDILVHPDPPFPPLEAVVEIPTLRPDGTIHTAAGYDPATRLHHVPAPDLTIPPIPTAPTQVELDQAVQLICGDLYADFPFDTEADRANAVALLLTPFIRPAIAGQTPLALLDAPEPGTGKGLLANTIAVVSTGRPAAARPLAAHDEEIRKMLTAVLLEGPAIIVLDNIEDAIRSPSLAGVLTTDEWTDRLLGRTETVAVPNRATWIATGNNLHVAGDIARRCYRIRLDAHQARPYTRTGFHHPDLLHWTKQHRGPLIAAVLTIARAWWHAGQPAAPDIPVIGGFTPWATTLAGILHHAGITGFLANLDQLRDSIDLETESWEVFYAQLIDEYGDRQITVAEIAREVDSDYSNLREHVPADLADWIGKPGFTRRLGKALLKREGRRYGSTELAVLRVGRTGSKVALWTFRSLLISEQTPQHPAGSTESETDLTNTAGFRGIAGSSSANARTNEHDTRNSLRDGATQTPSNTETPREQNPGRPGPTKPEF